MTAHSNKIIQYIKIIVCALLLVSALFFFFRKNAPHTAVPPVTVDQQASRIASSPLDATYIIEGQKVTLTQGKIEKEIFFNATSSMKITVSAFNQPTYVDLNGDGAKDAIFFLYEQLGGTGTFFYVVAAINEGGMYKGLNAIYLGDRVAPQTIDVVNGKVAVNYATVKDSDPTTAKPSVGVTKYVKIQGGQLVEVK
ncbi:MAG: hypothetical protein WCG07_01115 [Candidatus Taylorbacteria bacterium]